MNRQPGCHGNDSFCYHGGITAVVRVNADELVYFKTLKVAAEGRRRCCCADVLKGSDAPHLPTAELDCGRLPPAYIGNVKATFRHAVRQKVVF